MPRQKKEVDEMIEKEEITGVKEENNQMQELLAKMEEMAKMIENVNKENKELKEQIKSTPVSENRS